MTQKDEALRMAIKLATEAISQAIYSDDGLDGEKGQAVIKRLQACQAALSEPETVKLHDGWVSVEDRLPESKIKVLCAVKISPNHYDIHDGEFKNGRWRDGAGFDFWGKITHWRPLPAAPTLNEKG